MHLDVGAFNAETSRSAQGDKCPQAFREGVLVLNQEEHAVKKS